MFQKENQKDFKPECGGDSIFFCVVLETRRWRWERGIRRWGCLGDGVLLYSLKYRAKVPTYSPACAYRY